MKADLVSAEHELRWEYASSAAQEPAAGATQDARETVSLRETASDLRFYGGRYWVRTSDLFGVNEARYHCANRPGCVRWTRSQTLTHG